jgi:hypothetical protein
MDITIDSRSLLNRNIETYKIITNILLPKNSTCNADQVLPLISSISGFAWKVHPGKFFDFQLEELAYRVGKNIWELVKNENGRFSEKKEGQHVLHVASETYEVGGHTRLLLNLIKGDQHSIHSLVLTRQQIPAVPLWLRDAVEQSGGTVNSLAGITPSEQVAELQWLLCSQADKIFYHIHPDDSIAVAALAATPRPQVLTINHADHAFWLGSFLSDIVVCYRVGALQFSSEYRGAHQVMLLPTPLDLPVWGHDDKKSARKILSIIDEKILILTVASYYKFIPSGEYNYFKTISKIIKSNPQILVKVIGIDYKDDLIKLDFINDERIELLGTITDPSVYYQAADIYIDSMPFSSFTSLFEAMYFGCFPILQFNPVDALNIENEPALKGLVKHAKDEQEQIMFVQKAIDDYQSRHDICARATRLIENNYMNGGWQRYLIQLYTASSVKVLEIRELYEKLAQQTSVNQADLDAALISQSFHGDGQYIIFNTIDENIENISLVQLIKLCFSLICVQNSSFKLRQFSWRIKAKLKTTMFQRNDSIT